MGGFADFKRTCREVSTEVANRLTELGRDIPAYAGVLQYQQGAISDLMLDATSIELDSALLFPEVSALFNAVHSCRCARPCPWPRPIQALSPALFPPLPCALGQL